MAKAGLKFAANYPAATMTISLVREDKAVDSFDLPIGDVGRLFGTALGITAEAHRLSGLPNPHKGDEVSFAAVPCSGWNIASGSTPTSLSLILYFGEAVLGIQLPLEHAQLPGQRILTAAATGARLNRGGFDHGCSVS